MDPSEFLFPYEKVREEQSSMLKAVAEVIAEGKDAIIHAPTGLGKTAAAIAPALKYAIANKKTVYFLTSRHTQHDIAIETLKLIKEKYGTSFNAVDIIGKKWLCAQSGTDLLFSSDFSEFCKSMKKDGKCEFYNNTRVGEGKASPSAALSLQTIKMLNPCAISKIMEIGHDEKLCPYELAMMLAADSNVVVADYYYIFNDDIRNQFFNRANKVLEDAIIIVDEGHNLPDRIRELMTVRVTTNVFLGAIKEAKKFGFAESMSLLNKVYDVVKEYAADLEMNQEKLVNRDEFMGKIAKADENNDYEKVYEDLEFISDAVKITQKKSYISSVARFLKAWKGPDKGYTRILSLKYSPKGPMIMFCYRCLDPSVVTKNIIRDAHSTIMMSGTLNPTSMYKDLLGFSDDVELEGFDNPFHEENKLSLVIPKTTTKFNMRNEDQYLAIAEILADVVNTVPGNTAVFFPSYKLRDDVYKFMFERCKKTTLLEVSGMTTVDKVEMLDKFKQYSKQGAVLLGAMGGNFSEGIDLPGDMLKCVVVVGLPLRQPDLETKELIKYYDAKFKKGWDYGYIFPAFNKTLQSAGRCIRSETDKGCVVYLDERYSWSMYARCFPKDSGVRMTLQYKEWIEEFFDR